MTDLHRLAVVLHHANSDPPFREPDRADFYALKQAICEAFGTRENDDLQAIVDKCCCGDGIYRRRGYWDDDGIQEICNKCNGTAIYRRYWVRLERWRITDKVFHRPAERLTTSFAPGTVTIQGRIKHRPSKMAMAAQRVLALVFRPQYYLYLDQWKLGSAELHRFKLCLAYLLGFPRDKWQVKSVRFGEISANQFAARMNDVPIPF